MSKMSERVRRLVGLPEGALYSDAALERSRARVQRLGYFEGVSFETQQVDEDTVGVTIDVVERPTGAFSFGAGFVAIEGGRGNAASHPRSSTDAIDGCWSRSRPTPGPGTCGSWRTSFGVWRT